MIDLKLQEELEAYLAGTMTETDAARMRLRIREEPEVAEVYALLRLERHLGAVMAGDALDAKMARWTAEMQSDSPTLPLNPPTAPAAAPPQSTRNRTPLVAAAILLLLLSLLLLWYLTRPSGESAPAPNPPEIFESTTVPNAQDTLENLPPREQKVQGDPPPPPPDTTVFAQRPAPDARLLALAEIRTIDPFGGTLRGAEDPVAEDDPPLERALNALAAEEYQQARELLLSVPESDELAYLDARQQLAYLDFLEGRYAPAIATFTDLLEIGFLDEDKMRRYRGLALIASGDTEPGVADIRLVASRASDKNEQAAAQAFMAKLEQ